MARLEISDIEWKGFLRDDTLEEFKQYASIPDGSRDHMLSTLLKKALIRVQEYGDRALIPCTVKQTCRVPQTGVVRLYLGGGTVTSIVDTRSAEFVRFDPLPGGKLQVFSRGNEIQVTYRVAPCEADAINARPVVLRYATALYDGDEAETLNKILSESC